jgi:alkanesulfonate monooxygenase SsuD/methylene tetrahydromethanopterin reductase-like flavin-dependent oxidoreductase (luciferase family)
MEFGVHLPLISIAGEQRSLGDLLAFTEAARDLGYTHLCANEELRAILPIGSAEECAQKLLAYGRAGAQRIFLWPLEDERAQLELFRERVMPLLDD